MQQQGKGHKSAEIAVDLDFFGHLKATRLQVTSSRPRKRQHASEKPNVKLDVPLQQEAKSD